MKASAARSGASAGSSNFTRPIIIASLTSYLRLLGSISRSSYPIDDLIGRCSRWRNEVEVIYYPPRLLRSSIDRRDIDPIPKSIIV